MYGLYIQASLSEAPQTQMWVVPQPGSILKLAATDLSCVASKIVLICSTRVGVVGGDFDKVCTCANTECSS